MLGCFPGLRVLASAAGSRVALCVFARFHQLSREKENTVSAPVRFGLYMKIK